MNELLGDFADEAVAALRLLPASLEQYYSDPTNVEPINAVFRTVHSIKGNASFFGLITIKTFAHSVENSLDALRTNKFSLSANLKQDLITSIDALDEMISEALTGAVQQSLPPRLEQLLESIADETRTALPTDSRVDDVRKVLQALANVQIVGLESPKAWLEAVASVGLPEVLSLLDGPIATSV